MAKTVLRCRFQAGNALLHRLLHAVAQVKKFNASQYKALPMCLFVPQVDPRLVP